MIVDDLIRPTVNSRRERVRAMMRDDVLAAARSIIHEQGYKGLSMRALGRAVGVTAPTLYDYFPSKEAVLDALHAEGVELLAVKFRSSIAESPAGLPRLGALASGYRRFALDHPDLFRLMFARVDASYQPRDEQLTACFGIFEMVVRVVQEAIDLGELRPDDPIEVGNAIWAIAHGSVELELSGAMERCAPVEVESMFQANITRLLNGLCPDSANTS